MNTTTHQQGYIEHTAIINAIENGKAEVSLTDYAGCSSCAVKNSCGFSSADHAKVFEIPLIEDKVNVGDEVIVRITQEAAFSAVMLSYFVPLVLVTLTLITLVSLNVSEGIAGLLALSILLPYYGILFMKRKSMHKHLHIELLKR